MAVVLHIEDDEGVRASVALLLNTAGHQTVSAMDGSSAVAWVKASGVRPDVLIVDYALPGEMDGTDAVHEICGYFGRGLPTIVLSGELTNSAPPWLPGAPLFCVWKPVDSEVLLRVVDTFATLGAFLLGRGRLHR